MSLVATLLEPMVVDVFVPFQPEKIGLVFPQNVIEMKKICAKGSASSRQ